MTVSNNTREPSRKAMLRLNTEMHFGKVKGVSSDTKGRFVLTCSYDKTAKLWDAQDGTLQKTLRIPAEEGHDGKLYACAISPDGKIAAVGGYTGGDYQKNFHNIFLLNTTTGEIIQRLSSLNNAILSIEFHTDGILAAGLYRGNGIRIFKKSGNRYSLFKKVIYDKNGHTYGLAFDRTGRLATASYDGFIRLYDNRFKPIGKLKATGGKKPHSITFSDNGKKLAVGYSDSSTVEVLDGHSLEPLYQADTSGIWKKKKSTYGLTFNPDGFLFGGGRYSKKINGEWWRIVRRWDQEGKGSFIDFRAAGNTILDIKSFKDGSILVAGSLPDFGRYTAKGEEVFYKQGETANFTNRNRYDYFTVNADSSEISFKSSGLEAFTFSIPNKELKRSPKLFEKYREHIGSIRVTDWQETTSPKINGKEAGFLGDLEICNAVDIADDGTLLFGSNFFITALYSDGKRKWRTAVPGTAWTVNIAADGKTAVAAHDGGEIRWYSMKDGAVLLSLYVHPDGKRWVIWTPEGYYDASPGADFLIGWHINKGYKTPDFYTANQFRRFLHRPDIISSTLKYRSSEIAIAKAGSQNITIDKLIERAPVGVRIEKVQFGKAGVAEIFVKLQKNTTNMPERATLFVNGAQVLSSSERILENVAPGDLLTYELDLTERENHIRFLLENKWAEVSDQTKIHNPRWSDHRKPQGTLYVYAIGINRYPNLPNSQQLRTPGFDANSIALKLQQLEGRLYEKVIGTVLTDTFDSVITTNQMMEVFKRNTLRAGPLDTSLIFLAGHGLTDPSGNYHFITADTEIGSAMGTAVSPKEGTSFNWKKLHEILDGILGKRIVVVDTCQAGSVLEARKADINKLVKDIHDVNAIIYSGTSRQQSAVETNKGGVFTQAIIAGIDGKANYQTSRLPFRVLQEYVDREVPRLNRIIVQNDYRGIVISSEKRQKQQKFDVVQSPVAVIPQGMESFVIFDRGFP